MSLESKVVETTVISEPNDVTSDLPKLKEVAVFKYSGGYEPINYSSCNFKVYTITRNNKN